MGERRGVYRVLVGKQRERYHLEKPRTDGTIILKWVFRKWELFQLAQDRDGWRALVNAVMNLRVP